MNTSLSGSLEMQTSQKLANILEPVVEESPVGAAKAALTLKVSESLQVIIGAYHLYGFRLPNDRTLTRILANTTKHWVSLADECQGNWMKIAKYKLAAFFSVHLGLTLPAKPFNARDEPGILLGGVAHLWLKRFMRQTDKSNKISFLQTIKQTKKGMPRPSKEELELAKVKTIEKLTTQPSQDPPCLLVKAWEEAEDFEFSTKLDINLNLYTAQAQLERRVDELFREKTLSYSDRVKAQFPSTSATYNRSRSERGALGEILEHPEVLKGLRRPGGYMMTNMQSAHADDEQIEPEEWYDIKFLQTREPIFDAACEVYWHRLLKEAQKEVFMVEAVALPEPLKVRIITKGPALTQTLMRPIWKKMHTTLRNTKTFSLIGTPQSEASILDGLGYHLGEEEFYLSGDYEAATDNLHSWATKVVWRRIAKHLKLLPIEVSLGEKLLTENIIEGRQQVTGQLMGTILSFPILCIVNATATAWAYELSVKEAKPLANIPMLINGDDIAAKGNARFYSLWKIITSFFGLKESIGKTYFSRDFVDINSTSFQRVEEDVYIPCPNRNPNQLPVLRKTRLREIQYVNFGLLTGLQRSGKAREAGTDGRALLGARARELIRLSPPRFHNEIMDSFVSINLKTLKSCGNIPWYIPEWLGGIGLPSGPWGGPSMTDRFQARWILTQWNHRRPIPTNYTKPEWKTWILASTKIPVHSYSESKESAGVKLYARTVAQKCVDLLFDSNYELDDLCSMESNPTAKIIEHNNAMWIPVFQGKHISPMADDELQFRARYPSLYSTHAMIEISNSETKPKHRVYDLD